MAKQKQYELQYKSLKAREWRKKLYQLKKKGLWTDEEVIQIIQDNYGYSEKTIMKEWYNRADWIGVVFDTQFKSGDEIVKDIVAEENMIKHELWKLLETSCEDKDKISSLKEISNINKKIVDMLKETGFIDKVADKITIDTGLEKKLKENPDLKGAIQALYEVEQEHGGE